MASSSLPFGSMYQVSIKIEIAKDGRSVVMTEAVPEPCIDDLLHPFPAFRNNKAHFVTVHLEAKIKEMMCQYNSGDKCKTTTILKFDKEVVRSFVDENGDENNNILVHKDPYGRQRIMFFLRTMESVISSRRPATFVTSKGHHPVKGTGEIEFQNGSNSFSQAHKMMMMKMTLQSMLHKDMNCKDSVQQELLCLLETSQRGPEQDTLPFQCVRKKNGIFVKQQV